MNKKDLIKEIKLYSEAAEPDYPMPPGGTKPPITDAPTPPSTIRPGTKQPTNYTGSYTTPSNSIAKMQINMQELAQSVMQDAQSNTMTKSPDSIKDPATPNRATSKKSFNDFIAYQYTNPLDPTEKGVEWRKDPSKVTAPQKKEGETDIYELDVVMNTIKRIGSEMSEFKADGVWDFRTDNALKNMMGFAYSLLQLEGDFGLVNNIYRPSKLTHFKNILNSYKRNQWGAPLLSVTDKNKLAEEISQHLIAIRKLYADFRIQVTSNPINRRYIEGSNNFDTIKPKPYTGELNNLSKNETRVDGLSYMAPEMEGGKATSIPLKTLENKQTFEAWIQHIGFQDVKKYAPLILNVIKRQLDMKGS